MNQRVNEAMPTAQAAEQKTLASGTFHTVLHDTSGTATVYQLGDGSRVLRFTNFKTSNGPDVHCVQPRKKCLEIAAGRKLLSPKQHCARHNAVRVAAHSA